MDSPYRPQNPEDYKNLSDEIEKECENDIALQMAREEIYKGLTDSVHILKDLRGTIDPAVRLRACKEHLLLAGLYVEKVEHSGKVEFEPLKISRGDDE